MDQLEQADLIRRLFAVLTAMLEDGAAVAVEGQGPHEALAYVALAERIRSVGEQAAVIAEAAAAFASQKTQ